LSSATFLNQMSDEQFRILLIEDNESDVYLFKMALEEASLTFELTVLSDGAQALDFFRREGKYTENPLPDLAIMDLNLPKSDGAEVLEAVRQSEEFAKLLVVITSSSSSPYDRTRVEQFGVERYIRKPTDLEAFLQIGMVLKNILVESRGRGRKL
jgi:chemotaxis family two-component system response regulator Rcp1